YQLDPAADDLSLQPADPDLAVAGLLRLLRGEDADVAGAYVVARRPRRGADRRLGDPGGHPAEARRLRLHALQPADVPSGLASVRAAGLLAVGDRGRLHLAG